MFGHVPVTIDLTLEDEDSPNSGGVVIDAIRAARLLVENKRVVKAPKLCAFLFKAPPIQMFDSQALEVFDKTIEN